MEVNDIYLSSAAMEKDGIHVINTDEKTGIQALEHKHPKRTMIPGHPEHIDPEYIRHGTTCLIASRNAATGEVITPMIRQTHKENDFAEHIHDVVNESPKARYCFIMDNLNTHKSEALVRLVGQMEGISVEELGVKERREKYLTDQRHQVYIVYTPKHCSWMNQIECWFGILWRGLLNKRSSFVSIEDLETKIKEFIIYYNKHMKCPFKWNYMENYYIYKLLHNVFTSVCKHIYDNGYLYTPIRGYEKNCNRENSSVVKMS